MNRKSLLILSFAASVASFHSIAVAKNPAPHPHASTQAAANANAPWTGTQERGLDRAAERMSEEGTAHQKATQHQEPQQLKPRDKNKRH